MIIVIAVIAACLGGCSASRTIIAPESDVDASVSIRSELKVGDWVMVVTDDGGRYNGELVEMGTEAIGLWERDGDVLGLHHDIDHEDIVSIKKFSFSPLRTVGFMAGSVGLLFLIFINTVDLDLH